MEDPIIASHDPGPRRGRTLLAPPGGLHGRVGVAPRGRAGVRPSVTSSRGALRTHGGEDGFTLVELLVVAFMLVALVGIAVPTFMGQRSNAYDAAVQSDLRSAAIALESYRAQNAVYGQQALADDRWGFVRSVDVALLVDSVSDDAFCLRAWHAPSGRDSLGLPVVPEATVQIADAKADWAITRQGIVKLDADNRASVCP